MYIKSLFKTTMNLQQLIPDHMMTHLQSLVQRYRPSVDALAEHYALSESHLQFVNDIVRQTKAIVIDNNIEYTYEKINEAKERLQPIVAKINAQKDSADKAARAILHLMIEYMRESPLKLQVEETSTLALCGIHVFMMIFTSALVVVAGLQKTYTLKN